MKIFSRFVIVSAVALALMTLSATKARANQYEVDFTGGLVTYVPGQDTADATSFLTISGVVTQPPAPDAGPYGSIPGGTAVTVTPFAFNTTGVTPLWTIGSDSFDATTVHIEDQFTAPNGHQFLEVGGLGDAWIGSTEYGGTWDFSVDQSGSLISGRGNFEATNVISPVSDGARTILLLGVGLASLMLAGRKLSQSRMPLALGAAA